MKQSLKLEFKPGDQVELSDGVFAVVIEAEIFEGTPDYLLKSLDGSDMDGNPGYDTGWVRPEHIKGRKS